MNQLSFDAGADLDSRVLEILLGRAGPVKLTGRHHDLLQQLRGHQGARNPLPLSQIVKHTGMTARNVKAAVKTLVEDFGLPIGASRQEPYGYFLCVTAEDFDIAVRALVSEVESLSARIRALGGSQALKEILGQERLDIKE